MVPGRVDITLAGSLTTVTPTMLSLAGDIDNQLANTLAVFTLSNDVDFNAAASTNTNNGLTITAAGNTAASTIVGTNKVDRIIGGNGADVTMVQVPTRSTVLPVRMTVFRPIKRA